MSNLHRDEFFLVSPCCDVEGKMHITNKSMQIQTSTHAPKMWIHFIESNVQIAFMLGRIEPESNHVQLLDFVDEETYNQLLEEWTLWISERLQIENNN